MDTSSPNRTESLKALLFQPFTKSWDKRWARIERAFARAWVSERSANIIEADITAVLSALNSPLEEELTGLLCRAATLEAEPVMRVYTTSYFLDNVKGRRGRRQPDFIVGQPEQDGWLIKPRIVVELKGHALVNGEYGFCQNAPALYSNQTVCYPEGCWTTHDLTGVRFCWVGLRRIVHNPDYEFPWGTSGINASSDRDYFGDMYERQKLAVDRWHAVAIEDIADGLRQSGENGAIVADLIDGWLEYLGEA
ncbi:hypothetical protein AB0E01_04075 [Nocardia vinacea]|uniref:hypothetical protein n=1 Tax=Nocardia vinacea TaxID=96468 RepID=UPI0033DD705C